MPPTTSNPTFYITSPIYYVNDAPHIGHAYTTLACDMLARFYLQDGFEVQFLTGTDEHGQKIEKTAELKGMEPMAFVNEISKTFRHLFDVLKTSHTIFARTTFSHHYNAVQEMWRRLQGNNEIYLGSYSGWYSVRDEAFYGEDEIKDGKAPTGSPVEYVTEPSYFFKLSKWQQPLLDFYAKNPDFIAPESRRNEVIRFVEGGLKDLSISRTSVTWGVPVPDDPSHVIYVWLDALTIYISSLGFPEKEIERFWENSLHIVGKDILRFHAVYWPAFLMAAGLTPPKRIFAHGWWMKEGEKISKSLGNTIDPLSYVEKYGTDAFRYFLLREVPFGNDGDFTDKAFITRLNADLANTYGNLVQRTLAFVYKQNDGKLSSPGELNDEDLVLLSLPRNLLDEMRGLINCQLLHRVIEHVWIGLFEGNKYMDSQKPWQLKNSDPIRMQTILYVLCDFVRQMAILTSSIVPELSSQILDQLGVAQGNRNFNNLSENLIPGSKILEPKPLVSKVV